MLPWLTVLGLVATACGGASQTELFAPPDGDAGSRTDSGQLGVDSSSAGSTDTGVPDTAPRHPDSGSAPDTAPPPGQDAGPPAMATLPCGAGQPDCPAGGQEVCCISGDPGNLAFTCTDSSSCAGTGVPISCASSAQCEGEVCCGTETGTGTNARYIDVQCQPTCGGGVHFCDPAADDCPSPTRCNASMLLPGYFVCRT